MPTETPSDHQPVLTHEGERALRDQLKRLRRRLQRDFSERLREARGFGESHENDDYLQIKEEESVIASRIRRLEDLLESAVVVDEPERARGIVSLGTVVELRKLGSGMTRKHRVVGGYEPARARDISVNSPIGQALLGRRRGDEVSVELPGGRSAVLEIVGVRSSRD